MIQVRKQLSFVRWLTIVWAVYAVIWISLEGHLVQAILLGVGTTAVLVAHLAQRLLAGRRFSLARWFGITAVVGLGLGSGSVILTLLAMVFKTGLHAHGPEFSPAEIEWVISQFPLWSIVGFLLGVGFGLLFAARANELS